MTFFSTDIGHILSEPSFLPSDRILRINTGKKKWDGRVRNPVSPSNTKSTFRVPSHTLDRMVECESGIEEDQNAILDADPFVSFYQEQPVKIFYTQHGVVLDHVPDFLAVYPTYKQLIENKTDEDAKDAEVVSRTEFMILQLPKHGFEYALITKSELNRGSALADARFLVGNAASSHSTHDVIQTLNMLRQHGVISLRKSREIDPSTQFFQGLCSLILKRHIGFDSTPPINLDTEVWFV